MIFQSIETKILSQALLYICWYRFVDNYFKKRNSDLFIICLKTIIHTFIPHHMLQAPSIFIFFIILSISPFISYSQDTTSIKGVLTGTIINTSTQAPINGASIAPKSVQEVMLKENLQYDQYPLALSALKQPPLALNKEHYQISPLVRENLPQLQFFSVKRLYN